MSEKNSQPSIWNIGLRGILSYFLLFVIVLRILSLIFLGVPDKPQKTIYWYILFSWRYYILFFSLLSAYLLGLGLHAELYKNLIPSKGLLQYGETYYKVLKPRYFWPFPFFFRYLTLPQLVITEDGKQREISLYELRKKLQDGNDNFKYILLQANAGFGKTSFLIYFYLNYLSIPYPSLNHSFLRNLASTFFVWLQSILFFLEKYKHTLSTSNKIAYLRLDKFKQESMKDFSTFKKALEEKVNAFNNKLVFLDALDEAHVFYRSDSMSVQEKLIAILEVLRSTQCIISMRSQFFQEEIAKIKDSALPDGNGNDFALTRLSIEAFSDSQINSYLRKKFFPRFWLVSQAREVVFAAKTKTKELFNRPFLLHFIEEFLTPWYVFNQRFLLQVAYDKIEIPSELAKNIEQNGSSYFYDRKNAIAALQKMSGGAEKLSETEAENLLQYSEKDYSSLVFIYEQLVDKWLQREAGKIKPKPKNMTGESLDCKVQLFQLHKEIARMMYPNPNYIAGVYVQRKVREFFPGINVTSLLLRSMLQKQPGQDSYSFVHKSLYDYFLSMSLYDDPDFRWDFSFTLYAEAEQFFLEKCFYVDYANRVFREHQSGTAAYKEVFDQLNPEKFNRKQIERVLPKSIYMPLDEFEEKEFFGAEYALHYLKDWEVKSWDSEIKLKVAEHEFTFSIGGNLSLLEQLKKITELEYPKDWLSAQNFPTLILKKFRNINTLAFQPGLNKEVTNKIMECKKLKVLRIHQGDYAAFSNLALNELRKSLTRLEVYFWTNEEPDWELLERLWDEWREKLLLGYREKAGTPIHFQTVLEYLQKSKLPRLFSNLKIFSPTDYYTPLHVVAQRRKMEAHKQIAELLVQHKADVNAKTNEGITPLQIVAQHGETQAHKQITELLVRHKADVNAIAKEGSTALHAVAQHGKTEAHKQIAELLVHNKADVNAIDDKKWTPLHFVAQHGKTEAHKQIAELLVQHEADVNAKNNQGITPLHAVARHAETQAHRQIAELLVQHKADIDAIDDKKWTPLHFVAAHGETEAHKQIVELLVQNKADVNAKTKAGFAPLHFVAQHGKTEAHKQIAELLVQHKADIDVIDDTKWTPLHFVAAYGETQAHKQIAELLLETAKQQGFLQKYLEIRDGHNNLKAIELARIFKQPLIIEVISKYMQS